MYDVHHLPHSLEWGRRRRESSEMQEEEEKEEQRGKVKCTHALVNPLVCGKWERRENIWSLMIRTEGWGRRLVVLCSSYVVFFLSDCSCRTFISLFFSPSNGLREGMQRCTHRLSEFAGRNFYFVFFLPVTHETLWQCHRVAYSLAKANVRQGEGQKRRKREKRKGDQERERATYISEWMWVCFGAIGCKLKYPTWSSPPPQFHTKGTGPAAAFLVCTRVSLSSITSLSLSFSLVQTESRRGWGVRQRRRRQKDERKKKTRRRRKKRARRGGGGE